MGTIIICLLVLAVALLLYVISQGKKEKNSVQKNVDPLAGLPDIIGRPKGTPSYLSPTNSAQGKMENTVNATDNFKKRNEEATRVFEIQQEGSDEADVLPDWREEEEEMRNYAAFGTEDGFASGITFDELGIVQEMLARQTLAPSEEKTAVAIVSKIDGTELLGLLESKIGDASKRIAMLLDRGIADEPDADSSLLRDKDQESFDIGDYV